MTDVDELCTECWLHKELVDTQRVLGTTRSMLQRLLNARTPCIRCTFALATHGKHDAAFGIGAPKLCGMCAGSYPDEDWRFVEITAYDRLTREALHCLLDGAIVLDTLCPTNPTGIHPAGTTAAECVSCQMKKVFE